MARGSKPPRGEGHDGAAIRRAGNRVPDPGYAGKNCRPAAWRWLAVRPRTTGWLARLRPCERASTEILEANARDVAAAPGLGLNAAAVDRLSLEARRIDELADSLLQVLALPDPIGEVVSASRRPNGLEVSQVRVPLGVIFMIYESRPNVTVDAAALCVKSGNAAILRGGKEAIHSNRALHRILADELESSGLPEHAVQLVSTIDRDAVGFLLGLPEFIDLAIPRGGESLIRRVVAEARMPVMKHYQGICPVYVDAAADPEMAIRIILNSKVQRPGVCNAAETLLVHREIAPMFLPAAAKALMGAGVELRGDAMARSIVPTMRPRSPPTGIPSSLIRSWRSRSSIRSVTPSSTSARMAQPIPRP